MAQKVWMITGASRGLGAEIAKAVLAAGEKVIATGRVKDGLKFSSDQDALFPVEMDVTNQAQVRSGVRDSISRFGRIDVLVNNAGFGMLGQSKKQNSEEVERIYRTNVFGSLNVIRAVLPTMRQQRAGHILNFSSLGGFRASAGWGVYCSTKFAVEGITEVRVAMTAWDTPDAAQSKGSSFTLDNHPKDGHRLSRRKAPAGGLGPHASK
jgi:NADP-dependent 3-hydroxy acid dehydrogenase YdfG